ncbi:MAG: hypothetical protein ACR2NZ_00270 [Rubripirellula sp.]
MARQGSLCPWIFSAIAAHSVQGSRCALTIAVFCSVVGLAIATDTASAIEGQPVPFVDDTTPTETSQGGVLDVSLDCRWAKQDARFWNVRLRVIDPAANDSQLLDLENHSQSELTTGAFTHSDDRKQLSFRPRFPVEEGAVRFRVRASRDAKIAIEFLQDDRNPDSNAAPNVHEISLVDLLQGRVTKSEPIDDPKATDNGFQWSVKRSAGDQIRLTGLNPVPVYEPGADLKLSLGLNAVADHASRELTLQYSVVRVSHGETVLLQRHPVHTDEQGNCPPISIDELAPDSPGIYELRCEVLEDDEKIWARLRKREPSIARVGRPFLVMRPEGIAPTEEPAPWETVGTIRPSESSWSVGQWLPKPATRFIPGSSVQSVTPPNNLPKAEHVGESVTVLPVDDTFQATLPVLRPGIPHKISIRFPAARPVRLRVDIGGTDQRARPELSFVLTDPESQGSRKKWRKYTFVHYPVDEEQIWLTNLSSTPFRFESVSVEAGPNHLTKNITNDSEASNQLADTRKAILQPGDIDWVSRLARDVAKREPLDDCDPATIAMYELWVAVDRLRDHAIANGLNGLMLPTHTKGRTWFQSQRLHPIRDPARPEGHRLATVMKLLAGSGLDVYVEFDPKFLLPTIEAALLEQPSLVRSLTRVHAGSSNQYNLLRPVVQQSLGELVREVHQQSGGWDHFAGIALQCRSGSHTQPPQQILDDTESLVLFARTLGVTVDPKQLRDWASRDGKATVEAWIHDETQRCYAALAQSASGSPMLLALDRPSTSRSDNPAIAAPLITQSVATPWIPGETLRSDEDQLLSQKASLQQQLTAITAPHADASVFLYRERNSEPNEPTEDNVDMAADVSRVIDKLDPSVVVIERSLIGRGLPKDLPEVLTAFASTPRATMKLVPPIDTASQTVRVRSGHGSKFLYLTLMSRTPWDNEVDVETSLPIQWQVVGSGPKSEGVTELTETRSRISVPEGRLVVLRSTQPSPTATLRTWTTRVSGGPEALESIKQKVTLIVERIGILSEFDTYDALTNGGFEQSGGIGLIGWMHAQHPAGCVRIDDTENAEGKNSVLLTTDVQATTRTWIVSETISPPDSGRLAVSLACRAEDKTDTTAHRLKVSIEATRDGTPIRFSSEFDVPRNGQWGNRDVVLEADGIEAANVDSLRLTIDSLSGGRVWIDDVRLHDKFPTAKERAELQSQAFLAVQGLQRGNLTPSGRLLQNHWARHLLTHGPAKHAKRVIEAVQPTEEPPSVAERIRSWIPRPLRF